MTGRSDGVDRHRELADLLDAVRLPEGTRVEREESLDRFLRRLLAVEHRGVAQRGLGSPRNLSGANILRGLV